MQPVQAGQRAGQEQAATVTGLLSRGFPRSQQPSFPTVTSCSNRPSASETARGEHTVKSHLVLLSPFSLFSFHSSSLINFRRKSNLIVKPNTLSCGCFWASEQYNEKQFWKARVLLKLFLVLFQSLIRILGSKYWSCTISSGQGHPSFHPKTSLPMARCPKSGKLSRFAFGPVAVPSSVALARFGGSQAHRDHLQPPKIFLFSKNTYSFIPSGFGCFWLAKENKTEAHSERLDEPWRPLVCF